MNIFSCWTDEELNLLWKTATGSPAGLFILAGLGLIVLLVIALVGMYVTGKIGGFLAKVRQEDEDARREEEASLRENMIPEPEKEEKP